MFSSSMSRLIVGGGGGASPLTSSTHKPTSLSSSLQPSSLNSRVWVRWFSLSTLIPLCPSLHLTGSNSSYHNLIIYLPCPTILDRTCSDTTTTPIARLLSCPTQTNQIKVIALRPAWSLLSPWWWWRSRWGRCACPPRPPSPAPAWHVGKMSGWDGDCCFRRLRDKFGCRFLWVLRYFCLPDTAAASLGRREEEGRKGERKEGSVHSNFC